MTATESQIDIHVHHAAEALEQLPRLETFVAPGKQIALSRSPRWLAVLHKSLGHTPICLEAVADGKTVGILPLAYVKSWLFGRFLVSLPYLNYGGVWAQNSSVAAHLIRKAIGLADELRVRYLELRHDHPVSCDELGTRRSDKVNMHLALPETPEKLWAGLDGKVRNQIRNARKNDLSVHWGGLDLLGEFYAVFSRNMRDLGTPVYSRRLFRDIVTQFPGQSEFCVVRLTGHPVAAALLLHGAGITEVPSASSLRRFNGTCANMLMYLNLLERAIQRGQSIFDFGRSSQDGSTHRFKKQWGAQPSPAEWQYYVRTGTAADMRTGNPRFQRLIGLWKWMPVSLSRWLGPAIVRGIP